MYSPSFHEAFHTMENNLNALQARAKKWASTRWLGLQSVKSSKRSRKVRRRRNRRPMANNNKARWFKPVNGLLKGVNEIIPERPYRLAQPVITPSFTATTKGNTCHITGHDFVETLMCTTTQDVAGTVIVDMIINPTQMKMTRLQMQAACWETYRFNNVRILFKPTLPIQNGVLIGYMETDPNDDMGPVGNIASLPAIMAHSTCREVPVCTTGEWILPKTTWANELFCDYDNSDPRLTCAGRFILSVSVPLGLTGTTALGQIFVEYDIDFFRPQLDNNMAYGVAKVAATVGIDGTHSFGTSPTLFGWNTLGWKVPPSPAGRTFYLYKGTYYIYYDVVGTVITASTITVEYSGTGTAVSPIMSNQAINAASTRVETSAQYACTADDVKVTLITGATTYTGMMMFVVRLPDTALSMKRNLIDKASQLLRRMQELEDDSKEEKEEKELDGVYVGELPKISISTTTANRHKLSK